MENVTWRKIEQRKKENLRKTEAEYYTLHNKIQKRKQAENQEYKEFYRKCAVIAFGIIGIIYFAIPMIEAIVLS